MRPPLIGITTYGRDAENRFSAPCRYVDGVRRAGGSAVLLPPGEPRPEIWLELIDGILLAGGGDIDPRHYGGAAHQTIYNVDAERDTFELELVRHLVASEVPTLGVCRGIQVINVALGGTLHEHLPDAFGEAVVHRLAPREPTVHRIKVVAGCRLARILGTLEFEGQSWHHQAIKDPAPSLEVAAHAPDGVVEAVEKRDHPWFYALQWHPELAADDDPVQARVFHALVEASARGREKRSRS
jgi:putative glutamine amidotransferase